LLSSVQFWRGLPLFLWSLALGVGATSSYKPGALLAVMASIALLLVTLGMTFAAAIAASLPNNGKMPSSILA
jgi:hypothetical protein